MAETTLGGIEMELYKTRPDLWGILKALELSGYKREIWPLLSEKDKAILTAYSVKTKAIKAQVQASKR